MLDVLILNRNLRQVTDALVDDLEKRLPSGALVGVIDSGSREAEISKHTVVGDSSISARVSGLRINRGFNLGISWWLTSRPHVGWVLLAPNDAEIVHWDQGKLEHLLQDSASAAAIYPVASGSGYDIALQPRDAGLLWNIQEGPIVLNRDFCELLTQQDSKVFDDNNFRGYLSFLELSLRAYANNLPIVATSSISFRENEEHLLTKSHLIGTEEMSQNLRLLVSEGEKWLANKYGFSDRWTFENMVRVVFDEFVRVNPNQHLEEIV